MSHDDAGTDADLLAAIIDFPTGDGPPQLKTERERQIALELIHWLLRDVGPKGIVVKITALRCLMRWEGRPMRVVAEELGCSKQALSKQCNILSGKLGIAPLRSKTCRENCQRAALRNWERRRKKITPKYRFYSRLLRFHFAVSASASSETAGFGFSPRISRPRELHAKEKL